MDPQTLAMMSLLFGGGAGLPEGSGVNSMQDVLFNTILSPNWGMLTGSYDPYLTLPEQQYVPDPSVGMPIAFSAAQGQGTMARIASGLMSGDMPYDDALRFLAKNQADPAADVYGMDLAGEVSKIRDEVNSYNAQVAEAQFGGANQSDNVYAKAGLPTPDRQYSFEDMPKSARLQALMGAIGKDDAGLAKQAALYEGPAPMVRMRSAGRQGSPSAAASRDQALTQTFPRTAEEARAIAERSGADPDLAEKMFNRAMVSAEQAFAYDTLGKSTANMSAAEAARLRTAWGGGKSDLAQKALEKAWSNQVSAMGDKNGNPILDFANRGSRRSASALANAKPDTGRDDRSVMMDFVDPEWLKGREKYRVAQKNQESRRKRANAMAMGEQMALQDTGRTPFNDAMQERFGQLAMLRQIGLL